MEKWQPIETAPKDKTILLWLPWGNSGRPIIGKWETERYAKNPRPYWTNYGEERLQGKIWMRKNQPTHWMPLPPTPEQP